MHIGVRDFRQLQLGILDADLHDYRERPELREQMLVHIPPWPSACKSLQFSLQHLVIVHIGDKVQHLILFFHIGLCHEPSKSRPVFAYCLYMNDGLRKVDVAFEIRGECRTSFGSQLFVYGQCSFRRSSRVVVYSEDVEGGRL